MNDGQNRMIGQVIILLEITGVEPLPKENEKKKKIDLCDLGVRNCEHERIYVLFEMKIDSDPPSIR